MSYIGSNSTNSSLGTSLASWAINQLKDNAPTAAVDGFKSKYTAGGQNGWAMVHVAGVAGATLIGPGRISLSGQTGSQRAQAQFAEDRGQLQRGLNIRAAGGSTINYAGNPNYPLNQYIDEKNAELEDDGAGTIVAHELSDLLHPPRNKLSDGDRAAAFKQARANIFSLLCNK